MIKSLQFPINRIWIMWFVFSFAMAFVGVWIGFFWGRKVGFDTALTVGLSNSLKSAASPEVSDSVVASVTEADELKEGWYVYVTINEKAEDLVKLRDLLESNGFKSIVQKITVADDSFYKLFVGPEESRNLAEKLLSELKREPYLPTDMRVVNLTK